MNRARRALLFGVLGGVMMVWGAVDAPRVWARSDCATLEQLSPVLELAPGIHRELNVGTPIQRVAIGDPDVADLQLTSQDSFLVSTRKQGTTNINIWTRCSAEPSEVMLFVTGSATNALQQSPPEHDLIPSQVQTDIRFVEVNRTRLKDVGVSLFGANSNNMFSSPGVGPSSVGVGEIGSLTPGASMPLSSDGFNLVLGGGSSSVMAAISALETSGFAYTLARPSLVALSGQTASFLAGGEVPIPVPSSSSDSYSIEYKEFGIRLTLTPTVIGRDRITLKVAPEVSELDYSEGVTISGTTVPAFTIRRSETSISLASGESFVISGLISTSKSGVVSKLPGLGDLPIIGALFRNSELQTDETELLMIVTPHLVQPLAADANMPALPGEDLKGYNPSVYELLMHETGSFDQSGLSH